MRMLGVLATIYTEECVIRIWAPTGSTEMICAISTEIELGILGLCVSIQLEDADIERQAYSGREKHKPSDAREEAEIIECV